MRIAYIIVAHKLPDMLARLVQRLQSEDVQFYVHIDKKTTHSLAEKMRSSVEQFDNVHFIKSIKCYWGGFGIVQATLNGIDAILKSGFAFDYAALVTVQDYPLQKNSKIFDFLEQNKGCSFLDYEPLPSSSGWDVMDRIERWHVNFGNRCVLFPMILDTGKYCLPKRMINFFLPEKRSFLPGMLPFGGSSYWNLTREAVLYVREYLDIHPEFIRFFKTVFCPDEMFFQTLLCNSPLKEKIINDNLRCIEWPKRGAAHPVVFTAEDYAKLSTSPKLFARKFDASLDAKILDLIDANLLQQNESNRV